MMSRIVTADRCSQLNGVNILSNIKTIVSISYLYIDASSWRIC